MQCSRRNTPSGTAPASTKRRKRDGGGGEPRGVSLHAVRRESEHWRLASLLGEETLREWCAALQILDLPHFAPKGKAVHLPASGRCASTDGDL